MTVVAQMSPEQASDAPEHVAPLPVLPPGSVLAFVNDADTADRIRADLAEGGDAVRAVHVVEGGSLAAMPNDLAAILVDVSDSASPVEDMAALAANMPRDCAVIATGKANDVALFRDLLGAGVSDYLMRPLASGVVRKSVDAMVEVKRRERELIDARLRLEEIGNGALMIQPADQAPSRVAAVLGARGGVGATTTAIALAAMIGARSRSDTLLLDLDRYYGSVMLALDLDPSDALREALRGPDRVDNLFIDQAVQRKAEFVCALGAEDSPSAPEPVPPGGIEQLIGKLQSRFRVTVLDVPRADPDIQRQALSVATDIVLICDLTLTGVRDGMRMAMFAIEVAPGARTWVFASGAVDPRKTQIRVADLEKSLKRKIDGQIAHDEKAMAAAQNAGQPVSVSTPGSPIVKSLQAMVDELAPSPPAGMTKARPAKKGLFAGLFGATKKTAK